jgi:hypothetical protein
VAEHQTGQKPDPRVQKGWPLGWFGLVAVLVSWAVLYLHWSQDHQLVEFRFFVGIAALFAVLSTLSAHATIDAALGRPDALRLPRWAKDFQNYFQLLAPVGFTAGLIFAHFFWH